MRIDIKRFVALDSTNKYLLDNPADGRVIIADRQTAGYGRKGDAWVSPEGNIYLSFGFFESASLDGFSLAVGVAIVQCLEKYNIKAKVKWPNDVLVQGKKIAGILIETIEIDGKRFVCVGVGLNVNSQAGAICMRDILHNNIDKDEVLATLIDSLSKLRKEFFVNGFGVFIPDWTKLCHMEQGAEISFFTGAETIAGKYMGITEIGAIIIDNLAYVSGSIVQK